MNTPKFNKKLQSKIVDPVQHQQITSGYAIVLSYDAEYNTANIQAVQKKGVARGKIYQNVVCPTNLGIQSTAPEPGRPCWVDFKSSGSGSDYFPVITHFFNHVYNQIDHQKNSVSVNNIPRYILGT